MGKSLVKLAEVFGVSKDPVESYIERPAVDDAFEQAIRETRQVIIYGSSKQGKTALLQRHVPENQRITVHCGPATKVETIYRSILRQRGVEIVSERTSDTGREFSTGISAKFKALLPLLGSAESEAKGDIKSSSQNSETRKSIEFDLSVAQDVGELLLQISDDQPFYVLENFHYLDNGVQTQFAFDLRTFEEMGIRFIILGVWRERNRLIQYNGDLQDRISEVPVEPWEIRDFERIANKGCQNLNIEIGQPLKDRIFEQAHGSVGVVQELLKKLCERSGVTQTQKQTFPINEDTTLTAAIADKVTDYQSRHVRSLESIAAGSRTRRPTEDTAALYLPYYLVVVMIHRNYHELKDGIERKTLQGLIKDIHTTPDNVRTSDITGMMKRLNKLQADAGIVPPLFDFDPGTRRLKVVDSTLYFFIDNCDPAEVIDEIPRPDV